MKPVPPSHAEHPPGYGAVSAVIEAERRHALATFRHTPFEKRLLARIEHPRSSRAIRVRLLLAGSLPALLGLVVISRTTHRVEHVGLIRAAVVERALRATPFFAAAPISDASDRLDSRRAELAWSIQRIIAIVRREQLRERDQRRLVERALDATLHSDAARASVWQDVSVAGLAERLNRLRHEHAVLRLLATYGRVE